MNYYSPVGTVISEARSTNLSSTAARWAEQKRRITAPTLERLGVASDTVYFPDIGKKSEALVFHYREGWKARAVPEKSFVAGKGFKLSFWNEEAVLMANPETVFITEGELDCAALVEAGIPSECVLSVPNGAKQREADSPSELKGYGYVDEALRSGLSRVKRFVWCGDGDGPGLSLRSDMARLLGAARFCFVEWPDGCKDANEVLISDGDLFLRELVTDGSLPWPVKGLYRLNELPEPPPMTRWHPGFSEWESKVMLAPRTLSVVTGHPGNGKTLLFTQIWFQIVQTYRLAMFIASFETRPKPHIRRQLRTLLSGALEKDMTDEEKHKADAWISDHYFFAVHPEHRQTLEWFLDLAEVAVVRHGVRVVSVDPWNRLEGSRDRSERDDEYIARCLRTLYSFANDMDCHVQVTAHPAKMESVRRGKPPDLEDIAGAKHWDNMVDQGFVVHRPEVFDGTNRKTEAVLYHKKARFEELGYPCKLNLQYNLMTGRYRSTDYDTGAM
jgi:twinkle protein